MPKPYPRESVMMLFGVARNRDDGVTLEEVPTIWDPSDDVVEVSVPAANRAAGSTDRRSERARSPHGAETRDGNGSGGRQGIEML